VVLYVVYREYSTKTNYLSASIDNRASVPNNSDTNLVKRFVKTIIPHHQVAIERALEAYKFIHNQNLKWEARRIVLGQNYNV
jgi:uncharacterized protein (DUF305 family)